MKISPPIAVLAIVIVGVAGTAWLSPPPREPAQMNVALSYATYSKLQQQGKADGGARTVAQVIEAMAHQQ